MFLPSNMTLQQGDSGDFVSELQRRLAARDHLSSSDITGYFDGNTVGGVKAFQSLQGLKVDGIAGPETLRRLASVGTLFGNASGGETASSDEEEQASEASRHAEREYMNDLIDGIENEHAFAPTAAATTEQSQKLEPELKREATPPQLETQQRMQQELVRENIRDMLNQNEQRDAQRGDHQLELTRDHIRAQSPLESLDKPITLSKEPAQSTELEAARKPEYAIDHQPHERLISKEPQVPHEKALPRDASAETALAAAKKPLSPELERTERQLSQSAREESREVGAQLTSKGVRDNGLPPGTQLGDLSPDQTPGRGQQQQVGIG